MVGNTKIYIQEGIISNQWVQKMSRKSAREIIKQVLDSVSDNPKSIHEIAQEIGSNWESVKDYLVSLKEAGLLEEVSVGNKRVFSLSSYSLPKRNGCYFNLPVSKTDDKLIDSLYYSIRSEWVKVTGKEPGKVQVQKSLFKIDKICGLKLPIGWYQYGAVCVKPYDPSYPYVNYDIEPRILNCIHTVVSDYSSEPAYRLKLRQYEEENNELYKTKEFVVKVLLSSDFSKKNVGFSSKLFYDILRYMPEIKDDNSKYLLNEYVSLVTRLMTVLSEEDLQDIKGDIVSSFDKFWRLITLYQYKSDLRKYYPVEVLERHFALDISLQKFELSDNLSYLDGFLPIEAEPQTDEYKRMKNTFLSVRELTDKEKEENVKKSKNGNEFLLKEAGLD